MCCTAAFADDKVTDDEAAKIKEVVSGKVARLKKKPRAAVSLKQKM